jgi:Na+/H+ antiporter NhaA
MKKSLILGIMFVGLFLSSICFGASYGALTYSGLKTDDAVILAAKGGLNAINITADGTNACEVKIYNNVSAASGDVIWYHKVSAGVGDTLGVVLPFMIPFSTGAYADMTTLGTCSYEVYYQVFSP